MGPFQHPLSPRPSLLGVTQHPLSLNACQRIRSLFTSFTLGLIYHQYACAMHQIHVKPKPAVTLQSSSTVSWDVATSATINTSSLCQKMARSSTLGNSHFPLAPMQQSLKLLVANLSTASRQSTSILFMLTLLLGIASLLGASNMHLFLWTLLYVTIGLSVSNCYSTMISSLQSSPFGTKLGHLQDNSIAIAMKSFFAVPSILSFMKKTLPLLPAPWDVNHPIALLNRIEKSWYTCPEHISRRSKCLVRSGTLP
jgi:hypothetical protein